MLAISIILFYLSKLKIELTIHSILFQIISFINTGILCNVFCCNWSPTCAKKIFTLCLYRWIMKCFITHIYFNPPQTYITSTNVNVIGIFVYCRNIEYVNKFAIFLFSTFLSASNKQKCCTKFTIVLLLY